MRCPQCQTEIPPGITLCTRCGRSLIDVARVQAQLKRWQERLLDLTKANPLLGLNRSRVSKLLVLKPDPHTLFSDFALGEIGLSGLKMPRVERIVRPVAGAHEQEVAAEPEYRVKPGDLEFDARPADLKQRLRRIYDNARTTVEERGLTTLHLSFGILKWQDPLLDESVSPLLLVPCQLELESPAAAMLLKTADEEMQVNPALKLYLRDRYHVTVPDIPEEPGSETLAFLLEGVQERVRELGWTVEDQIWVSTYSFESLVLYKDLDALKDEALQTQIVVALARATEPPEGSEALAEDLLDNMPSPDEVPIPVLPTDSSQLKGLTVARDGRHLVVHGPPGTGKSQTIANLIADALGQNKKVLFVSAKMAALDVVYRRLSQLGLHRFCLEAHSTKAGKAKIIQELKRTLEASLEADGHPLEEELQDLIRVRNDLNTHVRELHGRREPLGLTIYQAIARVEKLWQEADVRAPLPWDNPLKVTRAQLTIVLEALADLGTQAEVFDRRSSHAWRGFAAPPGIPVDRESIQTHLLTLQQLVKELRDSLTVLAPLLVAPEMVSLNSVDVIAPVLLELARLDQLPHSWTTRETEELISTAALLESAAANVLELQSKRAAHDRTLNVKPHEAVQLLALLETRFRSWIRILRPSYWRWRTSIREYLKEGARTRHAALRSSYRLSLRIGALERWFEDERETLSRNVGTAQVLEPSVLTTAAGRFRVAARIRKALADCGLPIPEEPPAITEDLRRHARELSSAVQGGALKDALARINAWWPEGFVDGVAARVAPLAALLGRCEEILAAFPRIQEWLTLQHTLQKCQQLGLKTFIEKLGALSGRAARGVFERRFYTVWTHAALSTSPTLEFFSGLRHQELIRQFRELDVKIGRLALGRVRSIAAEPARRVATAQRGIGTVSEVGILRRELEKRRRIKPLRKLFAEIPTVLQALKPCMLMSPISVSTFLAPGTLTFDLVVFDEASQLPTQEAIPAILRGKQVVVAGDANQLPPTSFFMASVIFDETLEEGETAEELEPLESLLDDCVAIFPVFDQTHLRWHYRSKDERLIGFSNHYFYRDKPLITFPSPSTSTSDRGVRLEYVPDGVWDRGGTRTNRTEARRVAQLVAEQLERHPDRSLGVVAMNVTQREAIEEAIEEILLEQPHLAPLLSAAREPEPFFIKALENVQGDERDTMIISVGYGKSATGALSYSFGPLNQEGGWRRLNVLVTRARWHTILVTSMRSHELAGVNPNNRGAVALRNFIAYAEKEGKLPAETAVLTGAETNEFEDAVARALRDRGLEVDQQVGVSEYRIDLGVRDPRDHNRYILGIECDGATYHSAKTARDRDLLREQVLRELGWRLYRIWSTEWFRDRDKAIESALRAFSLALEMPVEESVEAPQRAPMNGPEASAEGIQERTAQNQTDHTPSSSSRRYKAGMPYRKYRGAGRREFLLDHGYRHDLLAQVLRIVDFEGPLHREVLTERLKEINDVARAGVNVQTNINRAIKMGMSHGKLQKTKGNFLKLPGSTPQTFRIPGDGVRRGLPELPPEEIAFAVLYIVEDQFGFQRDALPAAVGELFGFERAPAGLSEVIGDVVDNLIDRCLLEVRGYRVYITHVGE